MAHNPLKMANTVLEVADVAWKAMEFRERHQHHHNHSPSIEKALIESEEQQIESLRNENIRLRDILEENLKLLKGLSDCPNVSDDCPPDLFKKLSATVESANFLTQLDSLHQASLSDPSNHFPFNKATGADLEIIVDMGLKEPSLWVWVAQPSGEELSGIDNEAYVMVTEEIVVDGVANFIAQCILSNPKAKALKPEELQKLVAKALAGMNKLDYMFKIWHAGQIFLALSTWGFTLAGLYRHRAIVKVAAKGVASTGHYILKAL
ncbi:hypothetical protein ACHQM5_022750 [Ranunculus cassubicifolius]